MESLNQMQQRKRLIPDYQVLKYSAFNRGFPIELHHLICQLTEIIRFHGMDETSRKQCHNFY